jgi:hypothetical protein
VTILTDPAYVVPPPPPAGPVGTMTWLRATVSRFSAGADHARRRALVVERLAEIDPDALRERARETGDAAIALAEALGARDPAAAAEAVAEIAPYYQSGGGPDAPVARLVSLLPATDPERAAQDIAILVQAFAATNALIAAGGALDPPPVPATRRVSPAGELVTVGLAGRPFGEGPRACPGEAHAKALAQGVLESR